MALQGVALQHFPGTRLRISQFPQGTRQPATQPGPPQLKRTWVGGLAVYALCDSRPRLHGYSCKVLEMWQLCQVGSKHPDLRFSTARSNTTVSDGGGGVLAPRMRADSNDTRCASGPHFFTPSHAPRFSELPVHSYLLHLARPVSASAQPGQRAHSAPGGPQVQGAHTPFKRYQNPSNMAAGAVDLRTVLEQVRRQGVVAGTQTC